jgi:hypothetical protein
VEQPPNRLYFGIGMYYQLRALCRAVPAPKEWL